MDILKEWSEHILRAVGGAAGSPGSEILAREILLFGGAVIGATWGFFFGKSLERRRWRTQLRPGLMDLERAVKGTVVGNSIDRAGDTSWHEAGGV